MITFFRAHGIVEQRALCIDKQIPLDDLSLEEYKEDQPCFLKKIFTTISMKTCVEKRNTIRLQGTMPWKKCYVINDAYLLRSQIIRGEPYIYEEKEVFF